MVNILEGLWQDHRQWRDDPIRIEDEVFEDETSSTRGWKSIEILRLESSRLDIVDPMEIELIRDIGHSCRNLVD